MIQVVDPFHPLYKKILARASVLGYTKPTYYRQIRDNGLLVKMIQNGIWNDLDIFYNFWHDGGESYGFINWKNPDNFLITKTGTVTFTSLDGSKGNGSNGCYDTNWSPLTHGVNWTLNNAGFFIGVKESAGATEFVCGGSDAGVSAPNNCAFRPRSTVDTGSDALNNDGSQNPSGRPDASGQWHVLRTSSTAFSVYRNGILNVTYGSTASTGITTSNLAILARQVVTTKSGFSAKTIRNFGAGANLSGKESILNTLITDHQEV
jgi:hypothetical protein